MTVIKDRFVKEAESFDKISLERNSHNHRSDLRLDFENHYFYNNIWRDSNFVRAEYGPVCQWIISELKKADVQSVVELGCGTVFISLEMAREGLEVIGLDLSSESVKITKEYADSLPERKKLSLEYVCKNVLEFSDYKGQSVVCFGFLHHLPPVVLDQIITFIYRKINPGQLLLCMEPRYDHANYQMSALIYALRLCLPNHFQYTDIENEALSSIKDICAELAEMDKEQSEFDNESTSDLIVDTIERIFGEVSLDYWTAFYDKLIGSIRVDEGDIKILTNLLKQLDEMIVKYYPEHSRNILIKAVKK